MKAILFDDLKLINPTRTIDELLRIIDETKPDLILRAASRIGGSPWTTETFNKVKANISAIKLQYPNILIIGNLFFQMFGRPEIDDITEERYTSEYVYNNMAFDPAKFGITSITKCEYQCADDTCECKGPGEAKIGNKWIPDITIPEVQTLFIHQAEMLINAGCDGVWIDGLMFNTREIIKYNASDENRQRCVDGALYVCNEIKRLTTLYGKIPLISTWYVENFTRYIIRSIYWYDNLYDFVTLPAPGKLEIQTLTAIKDYDNIINNVKTYYNDVPIIAYIDWGFEKTPMWYFSQWYPEYTNCCEASDTPINREKRNIFQRNVLTIFTEIFNNKGIIWAYPVHGGMICKNIDCTEESTGPCCVKSYGLYHLYDSQAPEFQTYDTIKKLINPCLRLTCSFIIEE